MATIHAGSSAGLSCSAPSVVATFRLYAPSKRRASARAVS
jgi:hypothetical protein